VLWRVVGFCSGCLKLDVRSLIPCRVSPRSVELGGFVTSDVDGRLARSGLFDVLLVYEIRSTVQGTFISCSMTDIDCDIHGFRIGYEFLLRHSKLRNRAHARNLGLFRLAMGTNSIIPYKQVILTACFRSSSSRGV
jgi:hypothetical protein